MASRRVGRSKMRAHQWKCLWIAVVALVLVSLRALWATGDVLSANTEALEDSQQAKNGSADYGQNLLKHLLSSLCFPDATAKDFGVLLERHGPELERLVNTQRDLVWQAIGVVIELLPSLSEMDANGGRLRVSRETYAKVSNLMGRCESLSSQELAGDLRKAKQLIESRMSEADRETLIIDFTK
jgi:hypothetical protein